MCLVEFDLNIFICIFFGEEEGIDNNTEMEVGFGSSNGKENGKDEMGRKGRRKIVDIGKEKY